MRKLVLLVLPCLLAGCPSTPETPIVAATDGAVELEGLQASVPSMNWVAAGAGMLEVLYELRWVKDVEVEVRSVSDIRIANVWLLDATEPAVLRFWDSAGQPVGEVTQRVELLATFGERSVDKVQVAVPVTVPANSTSLSVALGASGLETQRVEIPPRSN